MAAARKIADVYDVYARKETTCPPTLIAVLASKFGSVSVRKFTLEAKSQPPLSFERKSGNFGPNERYVTLTYQVFFQDGGQAHQISATLYYLDGGENGARVTKACGSGYMSVTKYTMRALGACEQYAFYVNMHDTVGVPHRAGGVFANHPCRPTMYYLNKPSE